jgi:hypothetical protein
MFLNLQLEEQNEKTLARSVSALLKWTLARLGGSRSRRLGWVFNHEVLAV